MVIASNQLRSGGCLCGAVRFEIPVPQAKFTVCHCGMCRRWSAGPFMAVHCPGPAKFTNDAGLTWYRGSKWGGRVAPQGSQEKGEGEGDLGVLFSPEES